MKMTALDTSPESPHTTLPETSPSDALNGQARTPSGRFAQGADTDWINLIDHQTAMNGNTTMEDAQNFFRSNPDCHFSAVLDDSGEILGLCSQQKINITLSQWGLGFAVFARKPVRNHILEHDFRIIHKTPVYKVLNAMMKRESDFFDDVILIDARERFLGLIRVATLVHLQHEINRHQYQDIKNFTNQLNRNNQELSMARDSALQAAEMKSSFLANMSHEIRTPMNGILGMTKILMRTPLSEQQKRYAQTIQNSGAALLTILNDILDFSKIEAGKMELEEIPFDLAGMIEETIRLMEERAREKELEIFSWIDSGTHTAILSDPTRLRQILLNLTSNAIKFTSQGEVIIRVAREEETENSIRLKLTVRDTGIGISPENQQKLFQAFQQADSSTSRKFGGTGLGLTISQRLVHLLGGKIELTSEEGKGSSFSFALTFKKQPVQPHTSPSQKLPPDQADFWGVRCLIVSDSPVYADFLRQTMEPWNMVIRHMEDADQALDFCFARADQGTLMDIVLIDGKVGNTSATDWIRKLRANPRTSHCAVILMSQKRGEISPSLCHALNIAHSLSRPPDASGLQQAISRALDKKTAPSNLIQEPVNISPEKSESHSPLEKPDTGRKELQSVRLVDLAPHSSVRPLKLLLVEDSEVNREVAMIPLQAWNHTVSIATNGREALNALSRESFDGVLMDCQMPEMDGYEATREIRNPHSSVRNHSLYIIAMTANALQGDREKCLAAGMNDYVSKPVDELELIQALQRCAEHATLPLPKQPSAAVKTLPDNPSAPPPFPPHLVELFIRETGRRLEELDAALNSESSENAAHAAHTIKGTAGNFKATHIAELARKIESACMDSRLDEARGYLSEIKNHFDDYVQNTALPN